MHNARIFKICDFYTTITRDDTIIKMPIEHAGDQPFLGFKHSIRNFMADSANTLSFLEQNRIHSGIVIRKIDLKKRISVKKSVRAPIMPKEVINTLRWETTLLPGDLIRRMPVLENKRLEQPFYLEFSLDLYIKDVRYTIQLLDNYGYK